MSEEFKRNSVGNFGQSSAESAQNHAQATQAAKDLMIRTSIANYTGVDPHPWIEPDQGTIPTYLPIYRSLHICNTNFIETFKQHFTEDWSIDYRNKIHNEAMFALMYVTEIFNNKSLFG